MCRRGRAYRYDLLASRWRANGPSYSDGGAPMNSTDTDLTIGLGLFAIALCVLMCVAITGVLIISEMGWLK